MATPKPRHNYTKEEDEYILNCNNSFSAFVVDDFNRRFKQSLSRHSLISRFKTLTRTDLKRIPLSNEEKEWLKHSIESRKYNYNEFDWKCFANDYNLTFNKNKSEKQIFDLVYRLGLTVGRTTRRPNNIMPVGHEKLFDNVWYVKVKTDRLDERNKKNNYMKKTRYMYQKYYNVILKEDEYIVHLNGDNDDFSKENLYKIQKEVLKYMTVEDWKCNDPFLKKMLFHKCELKNIICKRM